MHHALFVRVLDPLAQACEQAHTLRHGHVALIAIGRDRGARHVLHHEPGAAVREQAGTEDLRDRRMTQLRQEAAFGVEARQRSAIACPGTQDLDRHLPAHRLGLLAEVDHAEGTFSELPHHAIAVELRRRGRRPEMEGVVERAVGLEQRRREVRQRVGELGMGCLELLEVPPPVVPEGSREARHRGIEQFERQAEGIGRGHAGGANISTPGAPTA